MAVYDGRDESRPQRLAWWSVQVGQLAITDIDDDHLFHALERLAEKPGRYYAGRDADGQPILRAKRLPVAPATLNRYAASLGAVFTWSIKKRLAPRAWLQGFSTGTQLYNGKGLKFLARAVRRFIA